MTGSELLDRLLTLTKEQLRTQVVTCNADSYDYHQTIELNPQIEAVLPPAVSEVLRIRADEGYLELLIGD